jgi:calcineurin-like phosphoesterase family protein
MNAKTWFTSDTHFGHVNIITFCGRPFHSISEMEDVMVGAWNEVVAPNDTVYHLGDFAMGEMSVVPRVRALLNGDITLIRGNHDLGRRIREGGFTEVSAHKFIEVDKRKLYLHHKPKLDFVPGPKAEFHICGHVHHFWKRRGTAIINCGVDVWGFRPVSLSALLESREVDT